MTWDAEGNLASVTEGSVKTSYLYDADGTLLIRDTAGGERVLYVGDTELHLKADGTLWAQRYYKAGASGTVIAVRTNATGTPKLYYTTGDAHGTTTLAVASDVDQTFVKRSLAPFGQERTQAAVGNWIDDKGFLGKTADAGTGLTHIGAREYDPTTATFLSVDPLLQTDKPQTLNGYSYGAQNPYTYADPTGTQIYDPITGLGMGNSTVLHNYYHEHHWINKQGHYTPTFYHSTTYKSWHHKEKYLTSEKHQLQEKLDEAKARQGSIEEKLDARKAKSRALKKNLDEATADTGMPDWGKHIIEGASMAGVLGLAYCEAVTGGLGTPACDPAAVGILTVGVALGGAALTYDSCATGDGWGCALGVASLVSPAAFVARERVDRAIWDGTGGIRSSVADAARSAWNAVNSGDICGYFVQRGVRHGRFSNER